MQTTTICKRPVPASALCADSRIIELKLRLKNTPAGGPLLGIIKPIWKKTLESEQRIEWLKGMLDKKLVVRDLEILGCSINEKLRTESAKDQEMEREIIIELMRIKYIDEKRNYRELRRIRETIRDWVRKELGRRKYNTIMEKLTTQLDIIKHKLKKKYSAKIKHLESERKIENMKKLVAIPVGLEGYKDCHVFNREIMEKMMPAPIENKLIGKVKIDSDEKSILELNPKFACLKKLVNEDMEQDIEMSAAKIRYEVRKRQDLIREIEEEETNYGIAGERKRRKLDNSLNKQEEEEEILKDAKARQIFDPISRKFNHSKRRVTDLVENNYVKTAILRGSPFTRTCCI